MQFVKINSITWEVYVVFHEQQKRVVSIDINMSIQNNTYYRHDIFNTIFNFSILEFVSDDLYPEKNWFVYLPKALEMSIEDEEHIVGHLNKYHIHFLKLKEWCYPHNYYTEVELWPERNNLLHFMPCGLVVNEIVKHNAPNVAWVITVNSKFYVNVTFLRFEIRDTGKDCSSSVLQIAAYKNRGWRSQWHWKYCGYRPPWSEIIGSNEVVVAYNQNDMYFRPNVSLIYCIIDQDEYVKVDLQYIDVGPIVYQNYYEIKRKFCLKWIINLSIGYVVHFSYLYLRNLTGLFYINDGPKDNYLYTIFSLHQTLDDKFVDDVNTTTKYYVSVIKFLPQNHEKKIVGNKIIELSFTKQRLVNDTKVLINRPIRIQHNGHILQSVYPISLDTHYTNVTFNIRKFHGWNEGGCNLGGYAIIQQLSKDSSVLVRSGPYCPGGGSNQPLITDDGPEYIVLGRIKTFLVIYAFGPEYWIDIDLITSTSLCEGFFDFPTICQAILEIPHNSQLIIQFRNFQLNCKRRRRRGNKYIFVQLSKFIGCVVAQSILYRQNISYELELLGEMHINMKLHSPMLYGINKRKTYLGAIIVFWRDAITGYRLLEMFRDNKDLQFGNVTDLTFRQTTIRTYHEISMVLKSEFIKRTNKCEKIIRSKTEQALQIVHGEQIRLTSLCATGYHYKKAMSFVYTIVPRYMGADNHMSNVYFNIQEMNCGKSINMSSATTIFIRSTFAQSFRISNNATIQIEVPNVSVMLAFEKNDSCSTVIFQYRVYLIMFDKSTLTSIVRVDFQVFCLFFLYCLPPFILIMKG